jgi:hypothetical protein
MILSPTRKNPEEEEEDKNTTGLKDEAMTYSSWFVKMCKSTCKSVINSKKENYHQFGLRKE